MTHNEIRAARMRRGLTQRQLALAAGIGKSTLSMIEAGQRVPRVDTALLIARALETTVEDLFWLD